MARIREYQLDRDLVPNDRILGTDNETGGTMNFSLEDLEQHLGNSFIRSLDAPTGTVLSVGDDQTLLPSPIRFNLEAEDSPDFSEGEFRLFNDNGVIKIRAVNYDLPFYIPSFVGNTFVSDFVSGVITAVDGFEQNGDNVSWILTTDLPSETTLGVRVLENFSISGVSTATIFFDADLNIEQQGFQTTHENITDFDQGVQENTLVSLQGDLPTSRITGLAITTTPIVVSGVPVFPDIGGLYSSSVSIIIPTSAQAAFQTLGAGTQIEFVDEDENVNLGDLTLGVRLPNGVYIIDGSGATNQNPAYDTPDEVAPNFLAGSFVSANGNVWTVSGLPEATLAAATAYFDARALDSEPSKVIRLQNTTQGNFAGDVTAIDATTITFATVSNLPDLGDLLELQNVSRLFTITAKPTSAAGGLTVTGDLDVTGTINSTSANTVPVNAANGVLTDSVITQTSTENEGTTFNTVSITSVGEGGAQNSLDVNGTTIGTSGTVSAVSLALQTAAVDDDSLAGGSAPDALIYKDGQTRRITIGSIGEVLTVTDTNPLSLQWATPGGGGSVVVGAPEFPTSENAEGDVVFINGLGTPREGVYIYVSGSFKSVANTDAVIFLLDDGTFSETGPTVQFTDDRVSTTLNSNGRVIIDTSAIAGLDGITSSGGETATLSYGLTNLSAVGEIGVQNATGQTFDAFGDVGTEPFGTNNYRIQISLTSAEYTAFTTLMGATPNDAAFAGPGTLAVRSNTNTFTFTQASSGASLTITAAIFQRNDITGGTRVTFLGSGFGGLLAADYVSGSGTFDNTGDITIALDVGTLVTVGGGLDVGGGLTVTGDTSGINRIAVIDRTDSNSVSDLQFEIIANDGTPTGAGFLTFRKEA